MIYSQICFQKPAEIDSEEFLTLENECANKIGVKITMYSAAVQFQIMTKSTGDVALELSPNINLGG